MPKPVELLSAYLAVGEDQLMRDKVLARIKERVAQMGDIDFNSEVFDGDSANGVDIVNSCNTLPFSSEKRLVVVKNTEKLAKASQETLVDYLEDPTDTTVLMLLATKLAKNTRLFKAVARLGKQAVIPCDEKKARELPTRVRDMAVSKGVAISSDAAQALVDAVGPSAFKLDGELRKLISYIGGERKEITREDVDRLVTSTAEIKPWDLQDAFSKKDAFTTLVLFDRMSTNTQPLGILSQLLTRIRDLISVHVLASRGLRNQDVAATLGWPEWKARNMLGWARGWRIDDLVDALKRGAEVEDKMKSGSDGNLVLEIWLLETVSS